MNCVYIHSICVCIDKYYTKINIVEAAWTKKDVKKKKEYDFTSEFNGIN